MSIEELSNKDNINIDDSNPEGTNQIIDISPTKESQQNDNLLQQTKNQNIAYKKKIPKKDFEEGVRQSAYSSTQKSKARYPEEQKDISEFTTNKKFRNTISGLNNNKLKFQSGLIDVILKVERENVNHYLKGDLAEMYKDINKDNINFKNDVFLANIDYFEKKTGNLDKKPIIPYNCNEDISFKIDKYPTTNEIIDKFAERTKNYNGEI